MKLLNLSLVAVGMLAMTACGGKKNVDVPAEEQVISIPCSGPDYFTTNEAFRANAMGESMDQMTAKKKALSNAQAQLASDMESVMKLVGDNYVKSAELNNKEEVMERFEQNARTVVNQNIRGVRQICEVATKSKNASGQSVYKYYVAIELSAENLTKSYYESLTKDEAIRIDYNYEKFKDTFDKEMENYKK